MKWPGLGSNEMLLHLCSRIANRWLHFDMFKAAAQQFDLPTTAGRCSNAVPDAKRVSVRAARRHPVITRAAVEAPPPAQSEVSIRRRPPSGSYEHKCAACTDPGRPFARRQITPQMMLSGTCMADHPVAAPAVAAPCTSRPQLRTRTSLATSSRRSSGAPCDIRHAYRTSVASRCPRG